MIERFLEWLQRFFAVDVAKPKPADPAPNAQPVEHVSGGRAGSLGWYADLWDSCSLKKTVVHADRIEWAVGKIVKNADRYRVIEHETGVPWYMIGAIHGLESSYDFSTYLHNGDPLGRKTTHVPKGVGPFNTWEPAAVDALTREGFANIQDWPIESILAKCEQYNGTGYLKYHPDVLSPYLWACTNHYSTGRYVEDGKWSQTAVSAQVGAAAIFKKLEEMGLIELTRKAKG